MFKNIAVVLLVVAAILASTVTVSAQYGQYGRGYGYDQFGAAQAEYRMRQMQRETVLGSDPYEGQYRQQYPAGQMAMGYGTDPCAAFVMQAQGDGLQPLVYGGIAAAGTRAITRNPRWVAGVGAVGAIVGAVKNSRDKRNGREALSACQQYLAMQQSGGQSQGGPSYQPQPGYEESGRFSTPAPRSEAPIVKNGPPSTEEYKTDGQWMAQKRCSVAGGQTLKNGFDYIIGIRRWYVDGQVEDLGQLASGASLCVQTPPVGGGWGYEAVGWANVNGGFANGGDLRDKAQVYQRKLVAESFPGGWLFIPTPRSEQEEPVKVR